jgi:hypothetical protein
MDHQLSVKTKAAEQYLLGELSPEECRAFEEHYFDCEECAKDVLLLEQFAANAASAYGEDGPPVFEQAAARRGKPWFGWTPSLTFACSALGVFLMGVIGYQNALVIPRLRSAAERSSVAEAVSSATLVPSARGGGRTVVIPPDARFIHLALEVETLPTFESYACDLRSASGNNIRTIALGSVDAIAGIHLMVPSSALPPGSYEAVLVGMSGGQLHELAHYHFDTARR